MSIPKHLTDLGDVMQLAFVPSDFDAALKFWTGTMGAGPFFVFEHNKADWAYYRGQPTEPDLTLALGHWGDMQIEIIHQHNDASSPYRDWRLTGQEGIHHVCILVEDLASVRTVCAAAGAQLIFNGGAAGAEWFYADTGGGPGTMVEMLRHTADTRALMNMIRDASRNWNGSDPIRPITSLYPR